MNRNHRSTCSNPSCNNRFCVPTPTCPLIEGPSPGSCPGTGNPLCDPYAQCPSPEYIPQGCFQECPATTPGTSGCSGGGCSGGAGNCYPCPTCPSPHELPYSCDPIPCPPSNPGCTPMRPPLCYYAPHPERVCVSYSHVSGMMEEHPCCHTELLGIRNKNKQWKVNNSTYRAANCK